ncbi:MAG: branched-chain amino acid ABC transporter permease [Pseudomonadota bacterium]
MSQNKGIKSLILSLLIAIGFLLPVIKKDPYILSVLLIVYVFIVAAVGFRFIYIAGRLTLGQAAFMGVGAYTSALLSLNFGVSPWLGLLIGGIAAGILALVIGYIVLRVGGVYFVIITLALAEILKLFWLWWRPVTNGDSGLLGVPGFSIASFQFGVNKIPYYYLSLVIMLVAVFVMYRIEHSRVGIALHALGQNDVLAEHLGINRTRYRVLVFTTASFFCGVVGSLYAHFIHFVHPDQFGIMASIMIQIYGITGGITAFFGPVVGTFVITGLTEFLNIAKEFQPLIYGPLLVIIMLFLPRGLISLPRMLLRRQKRA